jgi:Tissue inhibitor of metalloproteinase
MKVHLFQCTFAYLTALLLSLSLPSLSLACKCMPPNLTEALYDNPDSTVIAGRVLNELTMMDGSYDRYFVFKVNQVFKACSIQLQDIIIVSTSYSTASCGLNLINNTQYIFSARPAVVEANDLPSAVQVSVASCDYNSEWSYVSDDDKRTLRQYKQNEPSADAHCDTSSSSSSPSSSCQTGADCDQITEYCDVAKNQCVAIDASCPTPPVRCFAAPCTVTYPCLVEAGGPLTCLDNYCGGCNAIFLDADRSRVCNS